MAPLLSRESWGREGGRLAQVVSAQTLGGARFCRTLDQREAVPITIGTLEEEGRATAFELSMGDDGNAIPQEVGFIHVMGGQEDSAAWGRPNTKVREQSGQAEITTPATASLLSCSPGLYFRMRSQIARRA